MSKKYSCEKVNAYLFFDGQTEEVFHFYKDVFQIDFDDDGIKRYSDMPNEDTEKKLSEEEGRKVMHVSLSLSEHFTLMGADISPMMGMDIRYGNNTHLSIQPESLEDVERIYSELSVKGEILSPLEKSFWGSYWAHFRDRYGIFWMINFPIPESDLSV